MLRLRSEEEQDETLKQCARHGVDLGSVHTIKTKTVFYGHDPDHQIKDFVSPVRIERCHADSPNDDGVDFPVLAGWFAQGGMRCLLRGLLGPS